MGDNGTATMLEQLREHGNSGMVAFKSAKVGSCLEVRACSFKDHASVDSDFGCKAFPKAGDTNPCSKNMAWNYNSNGTITSVMSGKCLQSAPSPSSHVEITTCAGTPEQTFEIMESGTGMSVIREKGDARRCLADEVPKGV